MKVGAGKWHVEPADPPLTITIRGDGPGGLDFPATMASVSGNDVTVNNLDCSAPFADRIDFIDPLQVSWKASLDGGSTWLPVGRSTNQTYVTLGQPATNIILFHTTLHLGCKNAKGNTSDNDALLNIWADFADRDIARVSDGAQLTYYADSSCTNTTTAELLACGDGQCAAWARLMLDVVCAQGIEGSTLKVICP